MPLDDNHARQIEAGTSGRKAGHDFENRVAEEISQRKLLPYKVIARSDGHVSKGDPALALLNYVASREGFTTLTSVSAVATGGLATSEAGKRTLTVDGQAALALQERPDPQDLRRAAQHDRRGFREAVQQRHAHQRAAVLHRRERLHRSASREFPRRDADRHRRPQSVLRRTPVPAVGQGWHPGSRVGSPGFFWEEIDPRARAEWERIFAVHQDQISALLFRKAYSADPFAPGYLLHKIKRASSWSDTETAIYKIDELVALSREHCRFSTKAYSVNKGSFRDPPGVKHLAPRFGIIQMQRGGQTQHPSQLQFNLEASYFYKLEKIQL